MYDYIQGEMVRKEENTAIVDNNGIGYLFKVSLNTARQLPGTGDAVCLFTHLVHRDDNLELIGFFSEDERAVFRKLLSLSGVGPKQALRMLSGMSLPDFVHAVISGDVSGLTAIQGLGKKTAEKLVFELKGKLDEAASLAPAAEGGAPLPHDAVAALESLGFPQLTARKAVLEAVKESEPGIELELLIRKALRHV